MVAAIAASSSHDRHAGRRKPVDVPFDRADRNAGPFGEAECCAHARCAYAEFFDDRVLSLDERNSLMELHEPCLSR